MTLSIDLSDEELEKILLGDRGRDLLMEKVFNQILQAEMTEHLGADRYERSEDRSGYRNGSYERKLTTRVGQLTLEVPRCKDGSFSTKLFQRYQRSEKALVLALMEMVVQGVSTRRIKKITTELCGQEFSKSTVSRLTKRLDEQVKAHRRATSGRGIPLSPPRCHLRRSAPPGRSPVDCGPSGNRHQQGGQAGNSRPACGTQRD